MAKGTRCILFLTSFFCCLTQVFKLPTADRSQRVNLKGIDQDIKGMVPPTPTLVLLV
jgi:hypothetical protein